MQKVKLTTRDGGLVGFTTVLPMNPPAEAVVWGSRIFFYAGYLADDRNDDPDILTYREGMTTAALSYHASQGDLLEHMEKVLGLTPKEVPPPKEIPPVDRSDRVATGGPIDPEYVKTGAGAPAPIDPVTGQHRAYWVLSEQERAKGFVRPFRDAYRHKKCGKITTMSREIAETYQRDPKFYGSTFCTWCRHHFPVAEFTWYEIDGTERGETVGS